MSEEVQVVEQAPAYPAVPSFADRSVQEWRNDFTPEIRELRVTLTGRRLVNGQAKSVWGDEKGMICTKHFNQLVPLLRLTTTKAWTLSRISEETAERYVLDTVNNIQRTLMKTSYMCTDCGAYHDYCVVSDVCMAVEMFLYGNALRAVGGFESEKLSTMQQVTSHESYVREKPHGSGFLGLGG